MAGGSFNPYKVLGVRETATEAEIKLRFRLLAKMHHPDHGGDLEKFQQINRAYQLLMDPQQRTAFDQFGLVEGEPDSQLKLAAIKNLQNMFTQVIRQILPDKLEEVDLIGEIRKATVQQTTQLNAALQNLKAHRDQQAKTLEVLKKRLRQHKKTVPNLFVDALAEALRQAPAQIAQLEQQLAVGEKMLEILEDFSFDFRRHESAISWTSTVTATAGWR